MESKRAAGIFDILGKLLILLAFFLMVPLILSIYYRETLTIMSGYFLTALASGMVGLMLEYFFAGKESRLDISASMITTSLGWIVASLVMVVPFMLGFEMGFLDAYFEAMSGFTTTNMTLIENIEIKPRSLIFLRSLLQWLGGLGILSFFLLVSFRGEKILWNIFAAESHKASSGRPVPNLYRTVKILWGIYCGLSLILLVLLWLSGLDLFHSIIHAMATISTGGFSSYNESIAHFGQAGYGNFRIIEYIIIIFMFLSGVNFLIHYRVLQKDWRYMLRNCEFKFYIKLILLFSAIVTAGVLWGKGLPLSAAEIEGGLRRSVFQVLAMLTTTGFETEYIGSPYFPVFVRQIFLVMMLTGGCVGSTSGGFKVVRMLIMKRLFGREMKRLGMPRGAVIPLTVENRKVAWEEVYHITGLFFTWLLLILLGGVITAIFSQHDMAVSLSGMFSAVNNIGPSYITAGEVLELHPAIKITYILGMLAGRLEIIPVMALFSSDVWNRW